MKKGSLFIISAPSGTGKTTILKRIIAEMGNIAFSVSHTTRVPRPGEQQGTDYFFVDKSSFASMQQQDQFIEWAEVHGNLYGTSRKAVDDLIAAGKDVLLDIDVQGARQVKDKLAGEGVFIFISPPSLDELARRLAGRGTEPESVIATRLKNAEKEMKSLDHYDFIIVNDKIDQAVDVLRSVIIAERSRTRRSIDGKSLNLCI